MRWMFAERDGVSFFTCLLARFCIGMGSGLVDGYLIGSSSRRNARWDFGTADGARLGRTAV